MLTMLSFGGGQDSTALLLMYIHDPKFRKRYAPGDFLVVMSDTGDEHPETYRHVERIQKLCLKHHIEFVHLKPEMGFHSKAWPSLRGFYNRKNTVGSKAFPKTCTDKLKIQPIYAFLDAWVGRRYNLVAGRKRALKAFAAQNGKIQVIIGIAKGEERRLADPSKEPDGWKKTCVQAIYPLVDLGMDRAACQKYIAKVGQTVPPPSNCMLCPFMSEIELLWLHRNHPDSLKDWIRIEQNKINANLHKGEKNLGVWGRKLLPEKLEEAKTKYGHMTTEELNEYKMSHGHCVASRY